MMAIHGSAKATALLTEQDAAAYLSISPKTLQQWRWAGRGPDHQKLGRAVRYRISVLDAFIESCTRSSTTHGPSV